MTGVSTDAPVHEGGDVARTGFPDDEHTGAGERPEGSAPAGRAGRASAWARFHWPILAIAAAGLVLRLVLVLAVHPTCEFDADAWVRGNVSAEEARKLDQVNEGCYRINGDALYLYLQGRLLAEGEPFINPLQHAYNGQSLPGAGKPPVVPLTVAALSVVGLTDATDTRVLYAVFGGLSVLLIGVVAWRLGGRRIGVIAAVIAALYPMLWINDWKLLSESAYGLFVAVMLWAAYRFWTRPRAGSAALLGAAIGLACVARAESVAWLVFVAAPLAWGLYRLARSRRLQLWLLATMVTIAMLLPWSIYNMTRFRQGTFLSTGAGSVMLNGTCDSTFYGARLGYLDFACFDLASGVAVGDVSTQRSGLLDESEVDKVYYDKATAYVRENASRLPVVAAARAGRLWDVYRPSENTQLNIVSEDRGSFDSWAALWSWFALLPFGLVGLVVLWRRRIPISPFIGPAIVVTLVAMASFGLTRYRLPVDVGLCIAAAVGVDAGIRWVLRGSKSRAADPTVVTDTLDLADAAPAVRTAIARDGRTGRRIPWWMPALGAVAVVAAIVAVVVSAGVDSPRAKAAAATPADRPPASIDTTNQVCAYVVEKKLDLRSTYGSFDNATVDRLQVQFTELRALVPPAQKADLDVILNVLGSYRASGLSGVEFVKTLSTQQVKDLNDAVKRFLDYLATTCQTGQ